MYYTILYCTVQFMEVLSYGGSQRVGLKRLKCSSTGTVPRCAVLYCNTLYCSALLCTVLYCIVPEKLSCCRFIIAGGASSSACVDSCLIVTQENVYPQGPSVQFYKMYMDRNVRRHLLEYDVLAIIEWDVLVAHETSFEQLYFSAFQGEPFWVKGSVLGESVQQQESNNRSG